jgi:hypothetical protein
MRKPSPSLVISILALVIATSGTAIAAKTLITSSSQIKANAVNSGDIKDGTLANRDIKNNAVDSNKVRNGSLALDDLSSGARASLTDAETQALEAFRKVGPSDVEPSKVTRVITLANVPPGTYAIFGKTVMTPNQASGGLLNQGHTVSAHCTLDAGGDKDEGRTIIATPGAIAPSTVYTQITRSFGSVGTVTLDCDANESTWRAADSTIIAIRVGKAPRTEVSG